MKQRAIRLKEFDIIIMDLEYAYDWKMAIDIGSVAQTLNDQIFVLLHNWFVKQFMQMGVFPFH